MSKAKMPKIILCQHKECRDCSAISLKPASSSYYICCECFDLHSRIDRKPMQLRESYDPWSQIQKKRYS